MLFTPAESDATGAIRRFLAVPAWLGDHLAGQIAVADSSRDYDQRDLDLLTRLASVYAMGLRRKWDEDRLVYLSTHDGLTGLYNRSYFERQMSHLAQSGQAARSAPSAANLPPSPGLRDADRDATAVCGSAPSHRP